MRNDVNIEDMAVDFLKEVLQADHSYTKTDMRSVHNSALFLSLAISMKRIADVLEKNHA